MKFLWRLFLKLSGWDTSVTYPYHHLRQVVLIFGPHTSNWDVVMGMAYRSLTDLHHAKFIGKKELFRAPFGGFFRWIGGIPVDRHQRTNFVTEAAKLFQHHPDLQITLSPEGTRKKVDKLRTGFYYIAKEADVPIIMVGLDYSRKTLFFSEPFKPMDVESDFEKILTFYRPVKGKIPELGIS